VMLAFGWCSAADKAAKKPAAPPPMTATFMRSTLGGKDRRFENVKLQNA